MSESDGRFLGRHGPTPTLELPRVRAPNMEAVETSGLVQGIHLERDGLDPLEVRIYPDRFLTFGRANDATYVFPSDAVSRFHGQLRCDDDGRWRYRDLGSRNGSWLLSATQTTGDIRESAEELRAGSDHPVKVGDVVLLGNAKSRLVFTNGQSSEDTKPSHESVSSLGRELARIAKVSARHALPVFVLGPSGSGKTWLARQIHDLSKRAGPFVIVNCGRLASDSTTLHSELLGHLKGSFTGATADRIGKLQAADQGTLFLDEIESLPKQGQDFLIDLLDGTGSFAPLGASPSRPSPRSMFRLISASKVPLSQSGLRHDLAQRLATGEMVLIPGLMQRSEDIPILVAGFLEILRQQQGMQVEFTADALGLLKGHQWPGEIRELEATVRTLAFHEHSSREADGRSAHRIVLTAEQVAAELGRRAAAFGLAATTLTPNSANPPSQTLRRLRPADVTPEDARRVLAEHAGNKTHAAKSLGMALNTFKARLKES